MRNIPVNLAGYRLTVSENVEMKMRKEDGVEKVVTDDKGNTKFVVALMVKAKGQKGEEIRVTLDTDPGEGFSEDDMTRVELIDPRVTPYSFKNDKNETVSGVAWGAAGMKALF
ncbi:hypothetical protein [Amycolatopsis azurea]|uniref:Uncharacterized protein n=1 Tax=Amycolatopsis azurea DSM 43854 TaxID=1238180 RepID=M2PS47_9PSEU|nr:hypothetical protein [Amycolatopsis azurea]EMD27398.1 hypothetical protein C791_2410 [Amycolatopsis azurea DSM 43854]OOC03802.1 hypothetical protein B0293_26440 [Amycolatopsis azurea DSM 43854]